MASKRTIAVVGATGAQGGGLVREILLNPASGFAVRAITRDVNSSGARELARLGAELATADLDDESSLTAALRGAYGAYLVTFYWAHFSPEKEQAQAATLARAARAAGIEHAIWSTLEDTRQWVPLSDQRMPTLMGRYKVPHFDAKGESNRFFTELGVPTTFLLTSFYWDNFVTLGMGPKPDADGVLTLTLPMGDRKLPGIAAADIGRCAFGIFKEGPRHIGRTIGIAGEHLTGEQMAAAFAQVLQRSVRYQAITPEAYRALGFPGSEDLGNMFQFKRDFADHYCGARNVDEARRLNPALQDFRTWLERNVSRLQLS
jgi:uncharacterized protein YbjT (DUF2867 family)